VVQERIQSGYVGEIRNLALQDKRQWLLAFRELVFADGENDSSKQGVNALREQ